MQIQGLQGNSLLLFSLVNTQMLHIIVGL